jgi:hypothetical protein
MLDETMSRRSGQSRLTGGNILLYLEEDNKMWKARYRNEFIDAIFRAWICI